MDATRMEGAKSTEGAGEALEGAERTRRGGAEGEEGAGCGRRSEPSTGYHPPPLQHPPR